MVHYSVAIGGEGGNACLGQRYLLVLAFLSVCGGGGVKEGGLRGFCSFRFFFLFTNRYY